MGQAMSQNELEESIRHSFSDRLIVLFGLFGGPHPRGTHLRCEVDLRTVSAATGWLEDGSELVVQIVKGNNSFCNRTPTSREQPSEVMEMHNMKDVTPVDHVTEDNLSENSLSNLECFQLNVDFHHDLVSFPIVDSSCTHNELCHMQIRTGKVKPTVTEIVSQINDLCICKQDQNFRAEVISLLCSLSSCASLVDASFDAVINMLNQLWTMKIKPLPTCCDTQGSSIKDDLCSTEPEESSLAAVDFLLQNLRGKAIHPNIIPVLGAFEDNDKIFIFYPSAPYTLENILYFSPMALDDDWYKRFLCYQILSAIAYVHDTGFVHGHLRPSNILLTEQMWCWITGFHANTAENSRKGITGCLSKPVKPTSDRVSVVKEPDLEIFLYDLQAAVKSWCLGMLTNFDYLLILNKLAGRRWGDYKLHTVMPWVIDFSVRPDEMSNVGWRDLTKSKWRLAKGDEQLDFTYASAEMPHHVSDECLSELAVCIYKARRLPLHILRKTVRSVYEPNEYPVSLQRLYQWTPDECIPEFYSDASIFSSVHPGMSDLAIPCWAKDAEEFILIHRTALEGKYVSDNLHEWIDLTFGYKLSGEAAVDAKNVMLMASNPMIPRSQGRRQLFTSPHPKRQNATFHLLMGGSGKANTGVLGTTNFTLSMIEESYPFSDLNTMEIVTAFCSNLGHLSPVYVSDKRSPEEASQKAVNVFDIDTRGHVQGLATLCKRNMKGFMQTSFVSLLEELDIDTSNEGTNQDFLVWQNKALQPNAGPEGCSHDIFALGCIIAEIYLKRPLFDSVSLRDYEEHGQEPSTLHQLPMHVRSIVQLMVERDPSRRVSAACLLQSPFFPATVRVVHTFVSILHLIDDQRIKLEIVARLTSHGAFELMGSLAAKQCIKICLSSLVLHNENIAVQPCMAFLNAALLSMEAYDVKLILIPAIQKLLQSDRNDVLKVALLHVSFTRKLYNCTGVNSYLRNVHPVVLFVLRHSPDTAVATAASTLLVETCEEFGIPISYYQTVSPLLQQLGQDATTPIINTIIEIGKRLGELFVLNHLLPSLRAMISQSLSGILNEKSGPVRSWRMMVMKDAVVVLEKILHFLSSATIFNALVQEPRNVIETLLLHSAVDVSLRQHAAKVLLSICECIGADLTATYIISRLQPLFSAISLSDFAAIKDYRQACDHSGLGVSYKCGTCQTKSLNNEFTRGSSDDNDHISCRHSETQMDIVGYLYTGLASLIGITRLRKYISSWCVVEEVLFYLYDLKWEINTGTFQGNKESSSASKKSPQESRREVSSTSFLINDIGWSMPQPAYNRGKAGNVERNIKHINRSLEVHLNSSPQAWNWLPVSEDDWESGEYLNRPGLIFNAAKEERPWKVKTNISHGWRAHSGTLRALAVSDGETAVFTAGAGAKMRGLVRKWDISTLQLEMEYTGHIEVVNDICAIPWTQKVASCDGNIHLWNAQTSKCITVFSESSRSPVGCSSSVLVQNNGLPNTSTSVNTEMAIPSGMLFTELHINHYTCMHLIEREQRLVAGTGSGHLRFFDLNSGQQLHLWKCDSDPSDSFLVSAITCTGKYTSRNTGCAEQLFSVAIGSGMGLCQLFDLRAGYSVVSWKAHEGFITKLSTFNEYYLVSSSLDKTLCLWDIRRNGAAGKIQTFHGHKHGVSSFEIWGNSLLSSAGTRIGISTITLSASQDQELSSIRLHKLFSSELSNLGLSSSITTTSILPFSRFLLIGSDDGYLRVCK